MDNVQGGVLVNAQECRCFSIFWRADDVTRTMSKGGGGGACECLHPPFRKSMPVFHLSKFRPPPPPPPHLDGWLRAWVYYKIKQGGREGSNSLPRGTNNRPWDQVLGPIVHNSRTPHPCLIITGSALYTW